MIAYYLRLISTDNDIAFREQLLCLFKLDIANTEESSSSCLFFLVECQ